MEQEETMYKPSKLFSTFNVAGFKYYDGALALGKLKPGMKLKMVPEPEPWNQVRVGIYVTDAR